MRPNEHGKPGDHAAAQDSSHNPTLDLTGQQLRRVLERSKRCTTYQVEAAIGDAVDKMAENPIIPVLDSSSEGPELAYTFLMNIVGMGEQEPEDIKFMNAALASGLLGGFMLAEVQASEVRQVNPWLARIGRILPELVALSAGSVAALVVFALTCGPAPRWRSIAMLCVFTGVVCLAETWCRVHLRSLLRAMVSTRA